jgi:opacity protein-like surface antigen
MKKLMMIAAMMVAAVTANAQFEPGTFSIQPKAGFTVAWLSNMPKIPISVGTSIDKSPMVGAVIGAEAEYQLTDMISLAAGLNYSLQGSGWEDYSEGGVDLKDAQIELGYFTIPVVANFYLFKGFAVKAGIQPGFLTNAKMKYKIEGKSAGVNLSLDYDESIKDDCEKFDLSVPMGVSYQFKVPVVIDLRYNLGVSKVFKGSSDEKPKNNVVQLTVGYKFAL